MKKALADADLVQENGPERQDFKIKLFADMDAATLAGFNHRVEFVWADHERDAVCL